jgi:UDP-glucuronate 4-epimerase
MPRVSERRSCSRIICLRFFTVYGPRQRPDLAIHRFTRLIAGGAAVPLHGDGSSERDYTYITDAVHGVMAAVAWTAREGGGLEVVNVGGGARVRLDRLIPLIAAALGREARVDRLPDQPGDVRVTAAGLERAERVLGYHPRVGIEEGIRHFVRWYEEMHGHEP